MAHQPRSLRFALSLTTAFGFALPAFAQDSGTPPARVGQIANVSGSVSYNGAGSNGQWVAATENYPVTAGDSLFVQGGGRAALALNASRVSLAQNTELQVTELDANNFTATESQGEIFLNVTDLLPGQNFTVNTPRGNVLISQDGEYDVAAGDATNPTTLAVLAGAARIGGMSVPAGQAAYLSGTDQTSAQLGAIQRDDFIGQVLAEMAPPPPPYAPPVVMQMTGVAELSSYGNWDQSPQYGAVWYPSVDSGWAPYREGHWAFVAPWGWTWVDNAPWGFAPFHYGRWIHDDGRWGWVPASAYAGGSYGEGEQPVYAPAMVSFFGVGAGVAITATLLGSGSVGWVPLAPNEAYHPYYHADDNYIRQINRVDVHNYTQINLHNTVIINNYANRGGATYVPASAMAHGEQIGHYGRPVPETMFNQAHPVQGDFNQAVRPQYSPRVVQAPHVTAFAQRRVAPPVVISHQPLQPDFHPVQENAHPGFAAPGNIARPQATPQIRPQAEPEQAYHPQPAQQFHPQPGPENRAPAQQSFRPQAAPAPEYHAPAAPAYHPQAPAYYPPAAPAYHPAPEPAFHPQPEQQFHPQEAPHSEPAPHYNDNNKADHHP